MLRLLVPETVYSPHCKAADHRVFRRWKMIILRLSVALRA